MELEVCTSLGSMFHRRGALFVNEIRPANDAGWNGRKSPCCRPRTMLVLVKTKFLQDSTPAHCEKGKVAVEPDEHQALTYLNRERKVFWAGICLFPSSYPARYFRNEGFSLTGKVNRKTKEHVSIPAGPGAKESPGFFDLMAFFRSPIIFCTVVQCWQ